MQISSQLILADLKRFYKLFSKLQDKETLPPLKKRNRKTQMSVPQIMAVTILYHLSDYRHFKIFYEEMILKFHRNQFKKAVSYSRFIRLRERTLLPLAIYLQTKIKPCSGTTYIDSTPIKVCHNRRINKHKTFKEHATRGHHSMGWFYGFKLHITVSTTGDLVGFYFTKGNCDDRVYLANLPKHFWGKLFGDRGYISKALKEDLQGRRIKLITKQRRNMKERENLTGEEKRLLRCRGLVETVVDQIKYLHHLQNHRLKSFFGLAYNLIGSLVAYAIKPYKPSLYAKNKSLIRI